MVSIRYNGELVKFNLAKELRIMEHSINNEIKKQPTKYGFCLLIHKGLLTRFELLKSKRDKIYGRLFFKAKGQSLRGRPLSDDLCKQWVLKHDQYIQVTRECIKAKDSVDKIYACIRAFEQRASLMQTISSNTRSEKNS